MNIYRFRAAADLPGNTTFLVRFGRRRPGKDELANVSAEEVISVAATLERFEDVMQLSSALLAYLFGEKESLRQVKLNNSSPVVSENAGIIAETPTEDEIVEWVLGYKWSG